jgi:hypothetical protein
MSIRPERKKKIKSSAKKSDSFAWNEAIQKLQSLESHRKEQEGGPKVLLVGDGGSSELLKKINKDTRLHELCKCLTKTPEWKYHEEYCPVWKNGRIGEIESMVKDLIAENFKLMNNS